LLLWLLRLAKRRVHPRTHADPHVRVVNLPAVQNMLLAARALGLGATLTTLYLQFEKEAETALGLPPGVHSYALLPIGYPMGRFGPVRRVALADVVYEDRWGQPWSPTA
jgi:nitroreductase